MSSHSAFVVLAVDAMPWIYDYGVDDRLSRELKGKPCVSQRLLIRGISFPPVTMNEEVNPKLMSA